MGTMGGVRSAYLSSLVKGRPASPASAASSSLDIPVVSSVCSSASAPSDPEEFNTAGPRAISEYASLRYPLPLGVTTPAQQDATARSRHNSWSTVLGGDARRASGAPTPCPSSASCPVRVAPRASSAEDDVWSPAALPPSRSPSAALTFSPCSTYESSVLEACPLPEPSAAMPNTRMPAAMPRASRGGLVVPVAGSPPGKPPSPRDALRGRMRGLLEKVDAVCDAVLSDSAGMGASLIREGYTLLLGELRRLHRDVAAVPHPGALVDDLEEAACRLDLVRSEIIARRLAAPP